MKLILRHYARLKRILTGERIDTPSELILIGYLHPSIKRFCSLKNTKVYISHRSLKHIAEKNNDKFIELIIRICKNPHEIRQGKYPQRYLLLRRETLSSGRPCVVSIEINIAMPPVIVTVFLSDEKYLSNFDLLWRTGVS